MKTKTLFLVLAVLFAFTGCKTTKLISKTDIESSTAANIKTQTSNEVNLDIAKSTDNKLQTTDTSKLTDKGNVAETVTEETTKTDFSAPDSTGKQYPTSQTTTKRTINRNENKNLQKNRQQETDNRQKETVRDKSDSKSDSASVDKSKQDETMRASSLQKNENKTPSWVYYISSLCLVVFLGFVFFKVTK